MKSSSILQHPGHQAAQDYFRAFFEGIAEYAFIKDSQLRYIATNKALEGFFGMSKSQLFLKTDMDLMGEQKGQVCCKRPTAPILVAPS
jgi:PAS domain-containing protein